MINALALPAAAVIASPLNAQCDFDTEILPVLTKAGCNAGACHGAAAGRGGFHLSLLGADPSADYETIVHALEGRRINFATPGTEFVPGKADRATRSWRRPGSGRRWSRSGTDSGLDSSRCVARISPTLDEFRRVAAPSALSELPASYRSGSPPDLMMVQRKT